VATVELRFSAQAAHVRTARLVAATVARRAGVDEDLLDEIRLAVGEACSRAVSLHRSAGLPEPVAINLHIEAKSFAVEVVDAVSPALHATLAGDTPDAPSNRPALAGENSLGLALISGLVDDVVIDPGTDGVRVTMTWPALAG
jgi:anti-sigma regulatory factor (Ser/Thr protein kinase)